jgi:glycosyltransferase involved in cell wall biosynthesis
VARILQVCNSSFYLAKFLLPLVEGLVAAGYEVDCACEGDTLPVGQLPRGVRIFSLPFPKRGSPVEFARCIASLRRIIRKGRYDCVDGHNRNASIAARIAAWLERVPINLYTAHGFYFHDGQSKIAREATIALEGALARITDHTLSQSLQDIGLMTRRHLISRDRITHIGNGIDVRRFSPRGDRVAREQRLGLANGRFRVASVGRLVRGKGFSDLLRAFATLHARHEATQLLIVGGELATDIDIYHREFLAEAKALGLVGSGLESALVVTGITHEVDEYLATCDAFVLPSYREGMPRALLEAMCMGLAVIATDIRGCREIVTEGRDGLLYAPRDIDALAALLESLYASRELRASLGERARSLVLEAYSEAAYVERQIAVIDQLVGRPSRRRSAHGAELRVV